jgi:1,4-dihydroxy-6-naphthoate synthase
MFFGILSGAVPCPDLTFDACFHDVETLNQRALTGRYDVTKLSFHAYLKTSHYRLLGTGAALGYGCGPVVVARRPWSKDDLSNSCVALPGELTTAHLLYCLWAPRPKQKLFVTYDQVSELVVNGQADCGVLIHEGRFVFEHSGLHRLVDLGEWWEETTELPLPLGGIALRQDLAALAPEVESAIERSIRYAYEHQAEAIDFARQYAQEMATEVLQQHIDTFVTEQSIALGDQGWAAVAKLEELVARAEDHQ